MSTRDYTLGLVEAALTALDAERSVINDLNVYPVPDGDTGTNLFLTVRAVREELERAGEVEKVAAAAAVTRGSLMGARGNSGVILSQIVRGLCSVCSADAVMSAAFIKRAFTEASAAAYRAVKKPVEGTMLTVMREMATALADLPDSASLSVVAKTVLQSGEVAVERTTSQLAALRQAGVVDAGGYGLLVMAKGLADAVVGGVPRTGVAHSHAAEPPAASHVTLEEPSELSRYRYCTSFLLKGEDLPREELEELLGRVGDSALAVGDEAMVKVHVHTDDPGAVLSWAVKYGSLGEIEINDMHEQTRARDERLRESQARKGTAVVAVAAGAGNHALFRELGCTGIVDGGQSMNPSAAQLLATVDESGSDEVVILPNNKNVILTAEQAATMSTRSIVVVPTKSMTAGLTAMVAFDPEADAIVNARAMEATLQSAHSGEITVAVRDSLVGDREVKKDEVIGLVDGTLVANGQEVSEVLDAVLAHLATHSPDVLTVLTSLNGTSLQDDDIEAAVKRACPDAELTIHPGGQPLYPILLGAE